MRRPSMVRPGTTGQIGPGAWLPPALDAARARAHPRGMPSFQCQQCGTPVPYDEPIPRDSECESCHRDLRCCMNCRHYDPSRNNACRETEADLVEDKARRNFCEYFSFNRTPFAAGRAQGAHATEARAKLEGLFGGKPAAPQPGGREKLEGLFGGGPGTGGRDADARRKLDDLFRKKPADDEH